MVFPAKLGSGAASAGANFLCACPALRLMVGVLWRMLVRAREITAAGHKYDHRNENNQKCQVG
jgi:hypothetical protein